MRLFRRTAKSAQPIQPIQSAPLARQPLSPLEKLERQMAEEEAQILATRRYTAPVRQAPRLKPVIHRLFWLALLLGIPVGALALVNLPYAPIRRPIAEKAPFLLMPSYISMDRHFRQAASALQEATQLIDQATSPADLERGEQQLKQAQTSLDRLPTWVWSELPDTANTLSWYWYSWRLTPLGLTNARAEVGRLQGKLFQEKNAQTALSQAEQTLAEAKQQYQEAQTPIEKQAAMRVWQDGLEQMQQVPADTLAGKTAQQKISTAAQDLQAIGSTIGSQQAFNLIAAAKQFAIRAAEASQNPPHPAARWQQSASLWREAIDRLSKVSQDDAAYLEAQKLTATYLKNLKEIEARQQAESNSAETLREAKEQIARLVGSSATDNKQQISAQLQRIINQLESVKPGTTAHSEAQKLLVSAKKRLPK